MYRISQVNRRLPSGRAADFALDATMIPFRGWNHFLSAASHPPVDDVASIVKCVSSPGFVYRLAGDSKLS